MRSDAMRECSTLQFPHLHSWRKTQRLCHRHRFLGLICNFTVLRASRVEFIVLSCRRLALLLLSGRGFSQGPGHERDYFIWRGEKEQAKWKWQPLRKFLPAAVRIWHGELPHLIGPWPPCQAHAPAALRRTLPGGEINAGRGVVGPGSMEACENPLMRERDPIQTPLFNTFLWDNIGHYEVSRFTWDSIEGYNPFKQQTNKSLNPLFSYLLAG